MSRFRIHWQRSAERWFVLDEQEKSVAADFASLLEAETYVIERSERSER